MLPNCTEKEEETIYENPQFSKDPATPNLIYVVTNGYSDFTGVISYDLASKTVLHITTPEAHLNPIRPIPWEIDSLSVSSDYVFMKANINGWSSLFVMPLTGEHANSVLEVKPDWEGGWINFYTNKANGRPHELVLRLVSYKSRGHLAHLDITTAFQNILRDDNNEKYVHTALENYKQAAAAPPEFPTHAPKLIKFKSFDGLEVPALYYHPDSITKSVPVVIGIHGGPEGQATTRYRVPIHDYMLNELGLAVIYPNVRGSTGYGKKYLAADDIEKREDSVRDIASLMDYIQSDMKELDSSRIAVMGGSYGGYMVYACLVHFSSRLACGLANFGIAHWPSFLENTADYRRAHRRREYGDESDPQIRKFLESISPINHASKITAPLSIAHGETDVRVTVQEAIEMFEIVSKSGYVELMVCENEGHGFKQKSVIEFTNAAKICFLQKFLLSPTG